jgi:O-antigen ligase
MIAGRNTVKYLDHLLYLFYLIFFVSIICAYRGISSSAIGCILVAGIIKNKIETGIFFNPNINNGFIICCTIFYLVEAASLIYTNNIPETLKHLQIKSGLILIPLAICCSNYLSPVNLMRLMKHYLWIISLIMFYCLATAFYKYYFLQGGNEVFFYHELVTPFKQHAVQASIYIFIGLIYLLKLINREWYLNNKTLHFLLIFYFILCIVLLSSKLIIILSAAFCIYYFAASVKRDQSIRFIIISSILICTAMAMVLLTANPVSKRFDEIISGNISVASQKNFTPAIYFNGLQFRLLQWRFVSEILNENHAWLIGVTPAEAQRLLDNKYISTNMYIGETNNAGFLGYDTHNQFLQSTLQSGILGLLSFLAICFSMVRLSLRRKSTILSSIIILLILYGLTESYFETQYGIIIFTFFPLFFYYGTAAKEEGKTLPK